MVQPLIPKIVIVVKKLVQSDESKAVVVMEIWEELLETEISLLVPHLKGIQQVDSIAPFSCELKPSNCF